MSHKPRQCRHVRGTSAKAPRLLRHDAETARVLIVHWHAVETARVLIVRQRAAEDARVLIVHRHAAEDARVLRAILSDWSPCHYWPPSKPRTLTAGSQTEECKLGREERPVCRRRGRQVKTLSRSTGLLRLRCDQSGVPVGHNQFWKSAYGRGDAGPLSDGGRVPYSPRTDETIFAPRFAADAMNHTYGNSISNACAGC
jgi:hypothetical protein